MKIKLSNVFKRVSLGLALRISVFFIVKKLLKLGHFKVYFSQLGEDIILLNMLGNKSNGFYVDIGCNEPVSYNNTFYFYLRGWSGINIDANESLIQKFDRIRPGDINLCSAISDEAGEIKYYKSSKNPEVNTTDHATYLKWKDIWQFDEFKTVYTQKLDSILEKHLQPEKIIDFLSIDVEGHDFNVLKSIDLIKYRPAIIMIEIHFMELEKLNENEIYRYLMAHEYTFIGYVAINAYFKDNRRRSD
jgi:FkbM family methyltransferase